MDDKEYDVEVVSRHRSVFRIRARDRAEAEKMAMDRWRRGDPGDIDGYDWSELESAHAGEVRDVKRRTEDAELALRFIQERERLISRLGGILDTPAGHDAISAAQVASDLGWNKPGPEGRSRPDIARTVQTLEDLCASRRLVCFQRPRVRTGERGEIRLYCTPEYLDKLTASSLEGLSRQAG